MKKNHQKNGKSIKLGTKKKQKKMSMGLFWTVDNFPIRRKLINRYRSNIVWDILVYFALSETLNILTSVKNGIAYIALVYYITLH